MKLSSHYIEQQTKSHHETVNWQNHMIGNLLSYAYRDTVYDANTYPSNLHYHDYYELVILEEGDIRYLCDGYTYTPQYGDIVLIPPGKFHMSAINAAQTRYKRHVFYLYPSAFEPIGHACLTDFLVLSQSGTVFALDSMEAKQHLSELLAQLKRIFRATPSPLDEALGLSYIIQIFYLLNQKNCRPKEDIVSLPESVLAVQQYIDEYFSQISSVSEVTEHFFYSREYVARLFKKHFDTTLSEYIMKRRIAESQTLITQGMPLIDVAYQVGFGSLSTFIRAFRAVTGMSPSEYRKQRI